MNKVTRLISLLDEKNLDCLLIESKVTKNYLNTLEGSGCKIFITKKETFLILDGRYLEQAKMKEKEFTIILWNPQDEGDSYLAWIKKYMIQNKLSRIGVESTTSIKDYLQLSDFSKPFLLSNELHQIRMIKTRKEIEKLSKAIELADQAYLKVLNQLSIGMTDYEIAGLINYHCMKLGASGMSFETIVGIGETSAYPHVRPSGKTVKKGEIIMLDFGLILGGFQSDMTRMSCFGKPNQIIKEIHEVVLKANEVGISHIKHGAKASDIDKVAREVIEEAGYGNYFNHGLGHGIGRDNSSELPKLNADSEIILEENMVMSCEPGIYIPKVGGVRIEDNVWISEGKGIELNKIDKKIQLL